MMLIDKKGPWQGYNEWNPWWAPIEVPQVKPSPWAYMTVPLTHWDGDKMAFVSKSQISIRHICLILKLALYKCHIIIIIINICIQTTFCDDFLEWKF